MDAANFVREKERMCEHTNCSKCPIKCWCGSYKFVTHIDEIVEVVKKWSEENP